MLCFLQGIKEVTNVNAFEKFKVIQKWIVRKEITRYCWVSTNGLEPPLFWVPSGFFSESLAQASFSSSIQQSTNTYKGTPKLLRWTNQACIECILQKSVIWHRQMNQTLGFLWFPDSSNWQHLDEVFLLWNHSKDGAFLHFIINWVISVAEWPASQKQSIA